MRLKKPRHECDLPKQDETLPFPRPSPYASIWVRLYWRLRLFTTISVRCPFTREYFRSNAAFTREKNRHLTNPRYRYIIHPFSLFLQYAGFLRGLSWLFQLVIAPFYMAMYTETLLNYPAPIRIFDYYILYFNFFELACMIVSFFTGYTVSQTRTVVLEPKQIIYKYLLTGFVFDAVPFISTMLHYYAAYWLSRKTQIILFFLRVVRLSNAITILNLIHGVLLKLRLKDSVHATLILFGIAHLTIHFMTCVLLITPFICEMLNIPGHGYDTLNDEFLRMEEEKYKTIEDIPRMYYYSKMGLTALSHFYGCVSTVSTRNPVELLILSIVLICGNFFLLVAIAVMLQEFGMVNISQNKFAELSSKMRLFLDDNQYPEHLKHRIYKYYDYRYDKKFFRESKILDKLSGHLQMEVLLYSCKNLVEKVQLFKGLSKSAVGTILTILQQDVYMPGDYIMVHDQPTDAIYLILHGTCAVTLPNGEELAHVEDGDEFGDTKRMLRQSGGHLQLNLIAVECSEVYYLHKKDLHYVAMMYPEISQRIDALFNMRARLYYRYARNVEGTEEKSSSRNNEILMMLRRKQILDYKEKRKAKLGGHSSTQK